MGINSHPSHNVILKGKNYIILFFLLGNKIMLWEFVFSTKKNHFMRNHVMRGIAVIIKYYQMDKIHGCVNKIKGLF